MKMIQSTARAEAVLQGLIAAKAKSSFKIKSLSFNYIFFLEHGVQQGPLLFSPPLQNVFCFCPPLQNEFSVFFNF